MSKPWDGRIRADARYLPVASDSVQCIVTSPPYWGLRDYVRPDQIGLELTPREYVTNIREVAFELWRVLKKDGTLWLNLGDSYSGSGKGGNPDAGKQATNKGSQTIGVLYGKTGESARLAAATNVSRRFCSEIGFAQKQLVGIPWRVAFALQEDGWYLRSDIIWAKKNCMPESVTDRPTRSHEYIFLLTKSERYYYDAEAIKEPGAYAGPNGAGTATGPYAQGYGRRTPEQEIERQDKQRGHSRRHAGLNDQWDGMTKEEQCSLSRNKRDVWHIATQPYHEAHYATFPEEIPGTCIKAGSRPGDLVLDPFFGSGTVGRACERLSRRWIGCDLGYQDLQRKRVSYVQKELIYPGAGR